MMFKIGWRKQKRARNRLERKEDTGRSTGGNTKAKMAT